MHLKCVLVRENLELRIQKGFLKGSIQSICRLNAQKLIENLFLEISSITKDKLDLGLFGNCVEVLLLKKK